MQNPFFFGTGGVVSADIAVPDHDQQVAFYSRVLATGEEPLWRNDLMNNQGTPVIGLGPRAPEYDHLPLQWMPHFQVADVSASADNAVRMGGKNVMQSGGDDPHGQWAVLTDQLGAAFGVIPPVTGEQASQSKGVGKIAGLSLIAQDASDSSKFYEQVIGWKTKSVLAEQGNGNAGKFEMQNDQHGTAAEIFSSYDDLVRIPAVWLIHLPVGDIAESLRLVNDGGGTVVKEFSDPHFAVVQDPIGVWFVLQSCE